GFLQGIDDNLSVRIGVFQKQEFESFVHFERAERSTVTTQASIKFVLPADPTVYRTPHSILQCAAKMIPSCTGYWLTDLLRDLMHGGLPFRIAALGAMN